MRILLDVLMLLTALGSVQAIAGLIAVRKFTTRREASCGSLPPITILKPVCGDEPLLEAAIVSFCRQRYPRFQLIIGTQDAGDPALQVARRLQARFPECDISIVVDSTRHGSNRKIANLMNMLPFAKYDVLVFADSDLHVEPDYLVSVVAALQQPGTGLVTTLYGGEPAVAGTPALLGVSHISHSFLPGVLLATALGRRDCLGCTMALRRETLEQVGGLGVLADHLADDNVLGQKVQGLGLAVRLADTIPVVTVQERSFRTLWLHELRWARTIGALAPIAFSASVLQFPLFWALLAVVLSGGDRWAVGCLGVAWVIRAATVRGIDRALRPRLSRPATPVPLWLLPVRDLLSVLLVAASYWDDAVVWRGHTMHADRGHLVRRPGPAADPTTSLAEDETLPA
jgi:ceramide glucosyltransferase